MPNILISVPGGVFDASGRQHIATRMTAAAKLIEQIGDDPRNEFATRVIIEEIKSGYIFAGGRDPLETVIPVVVFMRHPEGVIEQTGRETAARLFHDILAEVAPDDGRQVVSSIAISKVDDGTWGASGSILRLADFARIAGYKHLQHLVPEAAA